jgi:GcrA cell cycle regulator
MNIQKFRWTDENVCKLASMSTKGMSAREIADVFGISRDAVLGKLFRMPDLAEQKRKSSKKMSVEMRDTASRLWATGMSAAEIARTVGKTVSQLLDFAHNNRDLFPARARGRKPYKVKMAASSEPSSDCVDPSIFNTPSGFDADRLEHGKPLHELSKRCCHWPLGNGGPFIFCAAPTQVTNGYCEHHRKRAFKPRLALD